MAIINTGWDVETRQTKDLDSLVPAGRYLLMVKNVEIKKCKDGKDMLFFTFQVVSSIDGKSNNFEFRDNVYLGDNEVSQNIFAGIIKSFNPNAKGMMIDTDLWLGAKICCDVGVEEPTEKNNYFKRNRIMRWGHASKWVNPSNASNADTSKPKAAATAATAVKVTDNTTPWEVVDNGDPDMELKIS